MLALTYRHYTSTKMNRKEVEIKKLVQDLKFNSPFILHDEMSKCIDILWDRPPSLLVLLCILDVTVVHLHHWLLLPQKLLVCKVLRHAVLYTQHLSVHAFPFRASSSFGCGWPLPLSLQTDSFSENYPCSCYGGGITNWTCGASSTSTPG